MSSLDVEVPLLAVNRPELLRGMLEAQGPIRTDQDAAERPASSDNEAKPDQRTSEEPVIDESSDEGAPTRSASVDLSIPAHSVPDGMGPSGGLDESSGAALEFKLDESSEAAPEVLPDVGGVAEGPGTHAEEAGASDMADGNADSEEGDPEWAPVENNAQPGPAASASPRKRNPNREGTPPGEDGPPSKKARAHVKPHKGDVANNLLSFGDELEADDLADGDGTSFSLAATTARRFQTEKGLVILNPMLNEMPSAFLKATDGGDILGARLPPSKVLGDLLVGAVSARGARPYMEDCHTVVRNFKPLGPGGAPLDDGVLRTFAGLYDGHNGIKAAEHANSRVHMALAQEVALRNCTGDGPPGTEFTEEGAMGGAFKRVFHTVDGEILERARAEGGRDGATALVVVRVGTALFTAHAGDSRAVLCRGQIAVRLTEDHKPNLPKERERVELAGGRVDFQRCWRVICEPRNGRPGSGLAVSRSFGDLDFKEPDRFVECEPDVGRMRLRPEDSFVIMASDGLWDVMDDQTACDIARDAIASAAVEDGDARPSDTLAKAAGEALLTQALNRSTMDNVTVLVLLFQWD